MSQLVIYQNGKPLDLNEHPSLLASLHASDRAVRQIDDEIERLEQELEELEERLQLHKDLGLPTKGIKAAITRRGHQLGGLKRRRQAHQKNYLELPNLGRSTPLQMDEHADTPWADNLSISVPIDVLRALKHARDQGIFEEFRIYHPQQRRYSGDPLIVGLVDGAEFYIASWR